LHLSVLLRGMADGCGRREWSTCCSGGCSSNDIVAQILPRLVFQVYLEISTVSSTWRLARAMGAAGNVLGSLID
jgi:hypothetical protein